MKRALFWWWVGGILVVLSALYLVGNDSVGLFDRDEPRYAQTSKQMLASGDWVVPRFLDQVRTAKPVFIYWCQAGTMAVLGSNEFAARFPSAVAMILTLGILAGVIGKFVGSVRAIWTIVILGTCGLAIAAAKMCITDSVLLLWITIAQICLYALYRRESFWVAVGMWVAVGLAGLTKGPVVLVAQLSTLLVLAGLDVGKDWRSGQAWVDAMRWWGRLRPLVGILIVAMVVGPWLYLVEQRSPGFLGTTLGHDVLKRTMRPLEGHKGPPGFYLIAVWATFFPWSLLLPTAASVSWKHRRLAPIRFAMAAAVGPWVVFELVQTKLVHYVLPAYPAIAFLTADALVRCVRRQHDDLERPIFRKATMVWGIGAVGATLVPWVAVKWYEMSGLIYGVMGAMTGLALIYAAMVAREIWKRRFFRAAGIMGAGMGVVIAIFYGVYLPRAEFLWVPKRTAEVLNENGASGEVVMVDYKEDSLAWYQGGTIRARDDGFLLGGDVGNWPAWIVTTEELLGQMSEERRALLEVVGRVRGWGYADGGKVTEVVVVRRRE